MTLLAIVVVTCLLLAASLAWSQRRLAMACRVDDGLQSLPATLPSLSVVRPTKGEDVEQLENFRAALAAEYPGPLETIFVFEDADDPGYRHAVQAIAEHEAAGRHGKARIVLAGAPPPGRTGKISNMIAGTAVATGDIIGFGDSDSRPTADLLAVLVADLVSDAGAGAIFAPPVTTSPPRTPGDVGYAIILNAYLGAAMRAFAGPDRSLPFMMGQCMLFRRQVLDEIGGIECADGQLVDDMYLGAQVVRAGYRNLMGRRDIAVINHGLRFDAFWRLWRRWLFFGRGGIPLAFMLPMAIRGLSVFVALGLLVACLATGALLLAAVPILLLLAEGLHYVRLNRLCGGAPIPRSLLWMVWVPQPMAVAIAVSMIFSPQVEWRGHVYRLDLGARLRGRA